MLSDIQDMKEACIHSTHTTHSPKPVVPITTCEVMKKSEKGYLLRVMSESLTHIGKYLWSLEETSSKLCLFSWSVIQRLREGKTFHSRKRVTNRRNEMRRERGYEGRSLTHKMMRNRQNRGKRCDANYRITCMSIQHSFFSLRCLRIRPDKDAVSRKSLIHLFFLQFIFFILCVESGKREKRIWTREKRRAGSTGRRKRDEREGRIHLSTKWRAE